MIDSTHMNRVIGLVAWGSGLLLLRFILPSFFPWWSVEVFTPSAVAGAVLLLVATLRLLWSEPHPWLHALPVGGSLALLATGLWELDRPDVAPDLLGLRHLVWALGLLTLPALAVLLGRSCRRQGFELARRGWHCAWTWSLFGLVPAALLLALVIPFGPADVPHRPFWSTLTSWLGDQSRSETWAFWGIIALSRGVMLLSAVVLWQILAARRGTRQALQEPPPAAEEAIDTQAARQRLSDAATLLVWALGFHVVDFDLYMAGEDIGFMAGKLFGVAALLLLRPLATGPGLGWRWTVSWAGTCALLTADALVLQWTSAAPHHAVMSDVAFLAAVASLPVFCDLMTKLCRRHGIEVGLAAWPRVRLWAVRGLVPFLSVQTLLTAALVLALASDQPMDRSGDWVIELLAEDLISWPLALVVIVVDLGVTIALLWTYFRFFAAAYKSRLPPVSPEAPAPTSPDPFPASAG